MGRRRRNKEQTIRRLTDAVGRIMTEKGYNGIGVNQVSVASGVSKPMIYEYFGGLNNLLKAYISEKDYWLPFFETLKLPADFSGEELKNLYINILQEQFRYFSAEKEMQKLILWQISEPNPLMRAVSETRERDGIRLLELSDDHFRNADISLKAVIALLVGGIYYNVLHNSAGTGSVSGIDISNEKEYELMINTVAQLVDLVWEAAGDKQQK